MARARVAWLACETVTLSGAVSAGQHEVFLRVEDVQGVSKPMQLAMVGKSQSGEYVLGTITLPE